jgi:hypothetical protein
MIETITTPNPAHNGGPKIDLTNSTGPVTGNLGTVNQYFGTVINFMGFLAQPEEIEQVYRYRGLLESAIQYAKELHGYKRLHECLHHMQQHCYYPILLGAHRFPEDALFLTYLSTYREEFFACVRDILKLATVIEMNEFDQRWIAKLEGAKTHLDQAFERKDKKALEQAMFIMKSEIGKRMASSNTHIRSAAESLLKLDLTNVIREIRKARAAAQASAATLGKYDEGIEAMSEIRLCLQTLVTSHDGWQELGSWIGLVEDKPEERLTISWPEMHAVLLVQDLVQRAPNPCQHHGEMEIRFAQTTDRLNTVFQSAETEQVASTWLPIYDVFRSQANINFFSVDKQLLDTCNRWSEMCDKMKVLLEKVGGG